MNVIINEKTECECRIRRIITVKMEVKKNKGQEVPDAFIGIAFGYADRNPSCTFMVGEILSIARQLHREWLRRNAYFGRLVLRVVRA